VGKKLLETNKNVASGGGEERKIIVSAGPRLREMLVAAESPEQCWAGIWYYFQNWRVVSNSSVWDC
jgi:hypothetical protein